MFASSCLGPLCLRWHSLSFLFILVLAQSELCIQGTSAPQGFGIASSPLFLVLALSALDGIASRSSFSSSSCSLGSAYRRQLPLVGLGLPHGNSTSSPRLGPLHLRWHSLSFPFILVLVQSGFHIQGTSAPQALGLPLCLFSVLFLLVFAQSGFRIHSSGTWDRLLSSAPRLSPLRLRWVSAPSFPSSSCSLGSA